jgi:hypothetical protein
LALQNVRYEQRHYEQEIRAAQAVECVFWLLCFACTLEPHHYISQIRSFASFSRACRSSSTRRVGRDQRRRTRRNAGASRARVGRSQAICVRVWQSCRLNARLKVTPMPRWRRFWTVSRASSPVSPTRRVRCSSSCICPMPARPIASARHRCTADASLCVVRRRQRLS